MSAPPLIAIYGRTYWDAEVEVEIASLGAGKGKQDLPVRVMLGGWPCNAAANLAPRVGGDRLCVVTVCNPLDVARLAAQLPPGVRVETIDSGETAADMPPVTVIVNPSGGCRLLRDPLEHRNALWEHTAVAPSVAEARLHLLGRLPAPFAQAVVEAAAVHGGRTGWVGGDALPPALERELDVMCVNSAEAGRLLGSEQAAPEANARALLARTERPGAIRVVTGRAEAPAVAAVREPQGVACYPAPATRISGERITRLKGAGDCFASVFCAAAWFDGPAFLDAPRVEAALAEAQRATEAFITQEWPR
ncbi:MAG: hypothetical protein ACYTGX_04935 [Planctomycetota bacterium]|jgi:sugar/nucleoside kinase (ribokinase family)